MERKGRVVESPEIEAKILFNHELESENNHLVNFFDDKYLPPEEKITKEEYLIKLREEFINLLISRAQKLFKKREIDRKYNK